MKDDIIDGNTGFQQCSIITGAQLVLNKERWLFAGPCLTFSFLIQSSVLPSVCLFSESIIQLILLLSFWATVSSVHFVFFSLSCNVFPHTLFFFKSFSAYLCFDPNFFPIYFLLTLNSLPILKMLAILHDLASSGNTVVLFLNMALKTFINIQYSPLLQ